MTDVLFYHLERSRLEDVLPHLLEKSLQRGWRAVVQCADASRRDALDRALWTFRDDSFLPHATDLDGLLALQPVVLTTGAGNPNGASVRFLDAGAAPADADAYQRIVILFSADEPEAVAAARRAWTPLKAAGHAVTYWQQGAEGRWEKKR